MEFEWDEKKRAEVIRTRDVDLLEAMLIFDGPVVTRIDNRRDYGEERRISIGLVGSKTLVVVHTLRGNIIRIITAWSAGRNERRRYQASFAGRNPADES